jgi:predicted nucleic acid-binding Zn ribbon protein
VSEHEPEHGPEHDSAYGAEGAEASGATPTAAEHDEAGLDLARTIARSLAGAARQRPRSKRTGRGRPRPPRASGAHPDDRDPQLLDTTIGRLIADQGWDTDVRVHGVFAHWDRMVGPEVAAHCSPEAFADGRLTVRTDSTAWATQMRLLAGTVVRRLNEELGDGTVTVIDVRGPSGPTWKHGPRSVRDGRGPRDTYG